MSVFSLKILVGTSVPCQALEASKQTSWKVSFFSTCEELDKSFDFATLSIAFILLGWSLYFKIAFKTGCLVLL